MVYFYKPLKISLHLGMRLPTTIIGLPKPLILFLYRGIDSVASIVLFTFKFIHRILISYSAYGCYITKICMILATCEVIRKIVFTIILIISLNYLSIRAFIKSEASFQAGNFNGRARTFTVAHLSIWLYKHNHVSIFHHVPQFTSSLFLSKKIYQLQIILG